MNGAIALRYAKKQGKIQLYDTEMTRSPIVPFAVGAISAPAGALYSFFLNPKLTFFYILEQHYFL
jgi:hypothetical protein